jgi:short-subunit dehydrogenase
VRDALAAAARGPGEPASSLLVLGAAVSHFGLFEDATDAALRAQLETNLLAPVRLVHALLPMLAAAAAPGAPAPAVVAIGSTFGSLGYPGFAAYAASKFGLRGFIEAMAREHADGPVRWQYLAPRATRTAFNPPEVDALNAALGTAVDDPADVAARLLADIARGTRRRQLGWPERLFARLNGLLPELVDRALAGQLPTIRAHAIAHGASAARVHDTATPR